MNGVTHIGSIVVETCNLMWAVRVAKAAERSMDVRGAIKVDGHDLRWSQVRAYEACGGFEAKRERAGTRAGVLA